MKALQEKRISLRSIWRRGLVVLSVVALAFTFAACSDDSGSTDDGPGGTGGVIPIGITLVTPPNVANSSNTTDFALEGTPVDLTGIRAIVRYSDDTFRTVTNPSEFDVYPPVYVRYGSDGSGRARTYVVGFKLGGPMAYFNLADNRLNYLLPGSEGIRYTGDLRKREFYSDDLPDFSGIAVELRHFRNRGSANAIGVFDGDNRTRVTELHERLQQTRFVIPKDYEYWAYSTPTNVAGAKPYITVAIPTYDIQPKELRNDGIFVFDEYYIDIPVDTIWFADSITVTPGTYNPVFLDQLTNFRDNKNSSRVDNIEYTLVNADDLWLERLRAAESTVTVTYRGGAPSTRTFTFDEAMAMRPGAVGTGQVLQVGSHNVDGDLFGWRSRPIIDSVGGGWQHDIYVLAPQIDMGARDGNNRMLFGGTHASGRDPRVRVNYRGMDFDLPVDVYTRAQGITAELLVDPLFIDTRIGLDAPAMWESFAARFRVVATYQLGRDANITTERVLTWTDDNVETDSLWVGDARRWSRYSINYTSTITTPTQWLTAATNQAPRTNRMQIKHWEYDRGRRHTENLNVVVYR